MASHSETVRRIMKGDFAEATDEEKVQAVDDVKKACATAAAACVPARTAKRAIVATVRPDVVE